MIDHLNRDLAGLRPVKGITGGGVPPAPGGFVDLVGDASSEKRKCRRGSLKGELRMGFSMTIGFIDSIPGNREDIAPTVKSPVG
jgi:hypothetical protein